MGKRSEPGLVANGRGIFVHNPRAAGSSLAAALGCWDSHDTAWELRKRYGFSRWSKAFTFGIVRHPWIRAVSWFVWNHGCASPRDFREWVATGCPESWNHFNWTGRPINPLCQVQHFAAEGGIIVDHIARFESLDDEIETICGVLDIPLVTLPHIGAATSTVWQEFYDDRSRDAIARLDRWAIKKFGYEFEEPR